MQHSENMNQENLGEVARLLAKEEGREMARPLLEAALAEVEHRGNFLPTYAVRRVIQAPDFRRLGREERVRLMDWTTDTLIAWLGQLAFNPEHPKRQLVPDNVTAVFYSSLHRVLVEWRESVPEQEKLWRILQVAGCATDELSELMGQSPESVEQCWLDAQAAIEVILEEDWPKGMLAKAGMNPPGDVTHSLEEIDLGHGRLWEIAAVPRAQQIAKQQALRYMPWAAESLMQDAWMKLSLAENQRIPENSERLAALVGKVIQRLASDRFRKEARFQIAHEDVAFDRWIDEVLLKQGGKFNPRHLAEEEEAIAVATANLVRDQPELARVMEFWIESGWSDAGLAGRLGISVATLGRRKRDIREHFRRQLAELGVEFGYLSKAKRLLNLYQVLETMLAEFQLPGGRGYQHVMEEVLKEMRQDDAATFAVLERSYLGQKVNPTEIAEELGVTTKELEETKRTARRELCRRIAARVKQA